jgi:GNAT superfamily N-acetyltransferase
VYFFIFLSQGERMKNLFVKLLLILGLTASLQASQGQPQVSDIAPDDHWINKLDRNGDNPPYAWTAEPELCFVPLINAVMGDFGEFISRANSFWYNRAFLYSKNFDRNLVASVEYLMGNTPYAWWVSDWQGSVANGLEAAGYKKNDQQEHAMYLRLNPLPAETIEPRKFSNESQPEEIKSSSTGSITVKRIDNPTPEQVDLWANVSAAGFGIDVPTVKTFIGAVLARFFPLQTSLYIAFSSGIPVTTLLVIRHSYYFVTLHQLSTLPAYRCEGLGHAIVEQAIEDAKEEGYFLAMLLSSPDNQSTNSYGYTMFTNLGFKLYATYSIYVESQGWGSWTKGSCLVS